MENGKQNQASLAWNELPIKVQTADTLSILRISLKSLLFDKAYIWSWLGRTIS